MTTHGITLWCKYVMSLTMFMSTMHFLIEIIYILKAIKSHSEGMIYDKQDLTLVVNKNEIDEIC